MSPSLTSSKPAQVEIIEEGDGTLRLALSGDLTAETVAPAWRRIEARLRKRPARRVLTDISEVPLADGAGIGLLVDLQRLAQETKAGFDLRGANEQVRGLLKLYEPQELFKPPSPPPAELSTTAQIGRWAVGL